MITLPKVWTAIGCLFFVCAALLVGRIVYEETILTHSLGPVMVGFALMHGALPFLTIAGLIGLLGGAIWTVASIVFSGWTRKWPTVANGSLVGLFLVLVTFLFIPYAEWEEITVRIAGPGAHGEDFMVDAAASGHKRFFLYLLKKGYDINYETRDGVTSLSGSAGEGRVEMIGLVLSSGASVDRKAGLGGATALMDAASMGNIEAVKALVKYGADPCALDNDGHNASGHATRSHHTDVEKYLSRFGCQEQVKDPCADPSAACVRG